MHKTTFTMAAALLVLAAGCAPFKSYRLPVDAGDAHRTFAPLASVASNMGLRYAEFDDSVNVQLDAATWVYFQIQNDAYNLNIVIDQAKVPVARREAKFAWAKKKADAIWAKAMAAMRSTGAMAPARPPPPRPSPGVNINVNID